MAVYFSWTCPAYCDFKDTALSPLDNPPLCKTREARLRGNPAKLMFTFPSGHAELPASLRLFTAETTGDLIHHKGFLLFSDLPID